MAEMMIDGVAFNVVVEGQDDAPAILVAHSLGADLTQWDPQMDSLARRFRVIRYDSRGHGHTEATPGPYSVEQLGRDALAVLDALGVKKTHYLGLSLGGIVGMWLLANAPERIDRAILANTSACFGHPDLWNGRIRHALSEGMDSLAGPTMDRWFTRDFHESAPGAIERIAARFRATSPEGYAATAAALRDADLREAIRSVQNRVLVIVGTQDPAATPAAGGLIADSIAARALSRSTPRTSPTSRRRTLSIAPWSRSSPRRRPSPPARRPRKLRRRLLQRRRSPKRL
jgi:3-oxoadipate enol-lactonase